MAKGQTKSKSKSGPFDVLLSAKYELDGLIVLNGPEGKYLIGTEEMPTRLSGSEMAKLGLNTELLPKLISEGYLIPITDQLEVGQALDALGKRR